MELSLPLILPLFPSSSILARSRELGLNEPSL
jgi:hypothetical protein